MSNLAALSTITIINLSKIMDAENFIKQRVETQINWYDKKSLKAQVWFKCLRIIEILAASSIPLIVGFSGNSERWDLIVAVLGALIVVIASLVSLNQFQENWIEYRTTCESLKHEKFLFLTNAEPYEGESPFPLFVQRVECLISKENSTWAQNIQSGAKASKQHEGKL